MITESLYFQMASDAAKERAPHWDRHTTRTTRVIRRCYLRLHRRQQMTVDLILHVVAPFVIGFAIYVPLVRWAPAVANAWYLVLVLALVATAWLISVECARACKFAEPPVAFDVPDEELPRIGVVVAAYLVNEADTILESLRQHLAADYPADKFVVVCAYNTPRSLPVESEISALAARDPRLVPLSIHGSTSKAENVNAALEHLSGVVDIVGFYDADHHPHPTSLRRVARWLGDAASEDRYDVVQGQCVVRNVDDSIVTRTVAAEFATIYAVSHPGRASIHGFGLFGGSNGFWRSEVIDQFGMDTEMLTEDIDATSRALRDGHRFAMDPRIISTELAPQTWTQLWRQRMRWAQGWWEVSQRHTVPLLRSPHLDGRQKRGVAALYVWRVLHPWIATQMWPLMAALLLVGAHREHAWGVPIFMLTTLVTLSSPFLLSLVAMRLAPPGLRERRGLFLRHAVVSALFYSEFKAVINRAAIVRDLFGVHQWTVTPRTVSTFHHRRLGLRSPEFHRIGGRRNHRAGRREAARAA